MNGFVGNTDVPLGLGMALAQNMSAMEHFAMLDEKQRKIIIENAGNVRSRKEMRDYVQRIAEGNFPGSM